MKTIKETVQETMNESRGLLLLDNYQENILFKTLIKKGYPRDHAILLVKNYTICDAIKRRIRKEQEEDESLRDINWNKRQGKSEEMAKKVVNNEY